MKENYKNKKREGENLLRIMTNIYAQSLPSQSKQNKKLLNQLEKSFIDLSGEIGNC